MPEPKTLEEAVEILVREQLDILFRRQRKYGPQNIARGGLMGVLMRKRDKLERAWTLTGLSQLAECKDAWEFAQRVARGDIVPPGETLDETLEDTLFDDANYSLIGLLLRRGWWGLPLRGE